MDGTPEGRGAPGSQGAGAWPRVLHTLPVSEAPVPSLVPPPAVMRVADARDLEPTQHTDVVVIGGGINGAGVARDFALRGLRVVLFERNDLAFGASGNSSGMIHGGGRYPSQAPQPNRPARPPYPSL